MESQQGSQDSWLNRNKNVLLRIIGIVSILILSTIVARNYSEKNNRLNLNESLKDSLETWKTKDSLHRARISAFESESKKDFLRLDAENDSLVQRLQQVVAEYEKKLKANSSATVVTNETNSQFSSSDTEVTDTITYFPKYYNKFNLDGWIYGNSLATKDSTTYNLTVVNKYDVVIGEEPQGFLGMGKPKTFAEITNHNPFTETKELRTYRVSTEPKAFTLEVGPSLIFDPFSGSVNIGVGVTYSIYKIRL